LRISIGQPGHMNSICARIQI